MTKQSWPAHTPYDGSAKPFTIGLKPLDPAEWIEIDEYYDAFLDEKERHYRDRPGSVFAAEAETLDAQREVLVLICEHLLARYPDRFSREGDVFVAAPSGRRVDPARDPDAPLRAASRLVQEDLVLMRKGENGWRLTAAALCFPSSWSLAEKFGRPLVDIHGPVPAFGPATRAAELIDRIFDKMKAEQPVERMNWSLQSGDALHHPRSETERDHATRVSGAGLLGHDPFDSGFVRVERQTLRKLGASGDILFTIRIHLDPLAAIRDRPDRAALAASFAAQLAALDAAQVAYKGLADDRDRLVEKLRAIASS